MREVDRDGGRHDEQDCDHVHDRKLAGTSDFHYYLKGKLKNKTTTGTFSYAYVDKVHGLCVMQERAKFKAKHK